MTKVWIIEDDEIMTECLARAINACWHNSTKDICSSHMIRTFSDAIAAVSALNDEIPDAILLDIMLTGPDGFTFLNELNSYHDTMNVPIVIVTSLDMSAQDLCQYNVAEVLQKETMTPIEIKFAVERALKNAK